MESDCKLGVPCTCMSPLIGCSYASQSDPRKSVHTFGTRKIQYAPPLLGLEALPTQKLTRVIFCGPASVPVIIPPIDIYLNARSDVQSDSNTSPPTSVRRHKSVTMSHAELASSYAALILADDGVEITVSLCGSHTACRQLPLVAQHSMNQVDVEGKHRNHSILTSIC